MRVAVRSVVIILLTGVSLALVTGLLFVVPGTPHHQNPTIVQVLVDSASDQELERFLQNVERMIFWDTFIMPAAIGAIVLLFSRLWLNLVLWEAGLVVAVMMAYQLVMAASLLHAALAGLIVFIVLRLPAGTKTAADSAT